MEATILIMMAVLSVGSINYHGNSEDRISYINNVMKHHYILLLQEHWLPVSAFDSINSKLENAGMHAVSGMDSSVLLQGRPYGGTAIIWNKDLKCSVTPFDTKCSRACAVILDIGGLKILIISVYMPVDVGHVNNPEYQETLNSILNVIQTSNIDNIIIGGDMNTDFSRPESTNTIQLKQFIANESLYLPLKCVEREDDFTYESKINGSRSVIDHFLTSLNLSSSISNYQTVHDGDNLSDHSLISIKFNLPMDIEFTPPQTID